MEMCIRDRAFGVIFTVDFLTVPESVGLHCIQVGFLDQSGTVCIGGTGKMCIRDRIYSETRRNSKDPDRNPGGNAAGMGAEMLSEKRTGI